MDATCKVQDNIHVFRLVHNMCPGFWVHIIKGCSFFVSVRTHTVLAIKVISVKRVLSFINYTAFKKLIKKYK